jgi:PPK2 family polyphosphate:nucleotide phosphotransferase
MLTNNANMKLKKLVAAMQVPSSGKVKLKNYDTTHSDKPVDKAEAQRLMEKGLLQLREMQDKLYSHNQHSVLVVIQAMDAAGKDSVVKHVLSGLNPTGVTVTPFRAPTHLELDHDYLWRHNLALPARGEIGIFIRSHYENVLVTRVHPELVLNEKIPGINTPKQIDKAFWKTRFRQINNWEQHLVENGTTIIKIFLHSSKAEQKVQLMERIAEPSKNWKFNLGDVEERRYWDDYMLAYEELLNHTSTPNAPWFVVPADDRWFARLSVGAIIFYEFEKLKLKYPEATPAQLESLQAAKALLDAE